MNSILDRRRVLLRLLRPLPLRDVNVSQTPRPDLPIILPRMFPPHGSGIFLLQKYNRGDLRYHILPPICVLCVHGLEAHT